MKRKVVILLAVAAGLVSCFTPALADMIYTYYFAPIQSGVPTSITNNLKMEVSGKSGGGTATFTFYNLTGGAGEIADIYFYGGALLGGTMSITNSGGVSYEADRSPGSLPAGADIGLPPSSKATFSAVNVPNRDGIDPGESVAITFALQTFSDVKTFDEVVTDLNNWITLMPDPFPFGEDMLAVGFHLQKIPSTDYSPPSVSFFVVPLPGALLLLGGGMVRLVVYARQRRNQVVA
jgi:hypothetical protein